MNICRCTNELNELNIQSTTGMSHFSHLIIYALFIIIIIYYYMKSVRH